MKKIVLASILLINFLSYSQPSKNELITEIEGYKKTKLLNSSYDFTFKEIFDAMTIMGNQYYGNSIKESESRGYAEYIKESGDFKESLSIEIKGDKPPFRLSFSYRKEKKKTKWKTEGELGKPNFKMTSEDAGWEVVQEPLDIIYTNLHLRINKILHIEFNLPEELLKKIGTFNNTQKRDRKKVIAGVDYEI